MCVHSHINTPTTTSTYHTPYTTVTQSLVSSPAGEADILALSSAVSDASAEEERLQKLRIAATQRKSEDSGLTQSLSASESEQSQDLHSLMSEGRIIIHTHHVHNIIIWNIIFEYIAQCSVSMFVTHIHTHTHQNRELRV